MVWYHKQRIFHKQQIFAEEHGLQTRSIGIVQQATFSTGPVHELVVRPCVVCFGEGFTMNTKIFKESRKTKYEKTPAMVYVLVQLWVHPCDKSATNDQQQMCAGLTTKFAHKNITIEFNWESFHFGRT